MSVEAALLGTVLAMVVGAVGIGAWLLYWQLRRTPPSAYAEMEETISDMNRQMGEMRAQQAADHLEIRRLRAEMVQMEERYRATIAALVREFREVTGHDPTTPLPVEGVPVAAVPIRINRPAAGFARKLADAFSADELTGMAFELGIDGELTGDSVSERARSLVAVAGRHGQMVDLQAIARRDRPEGGF